MPVRTSARAYFDYSIEPAFGTKVSPKTRALGMEESISDFTAANGQIPLFQLGRRDPIDFAYGKTDVSFNADFKMSNPWFFQLFFGSIVPTGAGNLKTHTMKIEKEPKTANIQVGMDLSGRALMYELFGSVAQSLRLGASIDGYVDCSIPFKCGKIERATSLNANPITDDISFPYRFNHATIKIAGAVIASIQSFNLNIDQGGDLEYNLGSNDAIGAFSKAFNCTGSLNLFIKNDDYFQKVLDREEYANAEFLFSNGASGDAERSIQLNATGVGLSDAGTSASSVEELKQDISFQCRSITVVAKNTKAAAP